MRKSILIKNRIKLKDMKKLLLISSLLILFQCVKGNDDFNNGYNPSEKLVLKDVSYGELPRQKFNAYLPANRNKNTKAIILIHGGGWKSGDKSDFDLFASAFADSAIAAFAINYRYANTNDRVSYVEILKDIDKAISCIIDSSVTFSFNPKQICLLGHSAGAHLALLYTFRDNKKGVVNKVVSLAGPTDLTDPQLLNISGINDLVNTLVGNDLDKREDASPINYAGEIPTYLYHGKADEVVPSQQSVKFFEKISSRNPRNRCAIIEGCGHGFDLAEFIKILNETVAFVKE